MFKELASLTVGLLAIGHDEDAALAIMRRVGADCIPPGRVMLLRMLAASDEARATADLATECSMPTETARRVLQDLAALRLVTRSSQGSGKADLWEIANGTMGKWMEAGL